jgi:hypothetical protein
MSADGLRDDVGGYSYTVDRIDLHPGAYAHAPCVCPANSGNVGHSVRNDIALLHLKLPADAPLPTTRAAPVPVLTSLTDSTSIDGGGVHVQLDQAADFGASTTVQPIVVGLGISDQGIDFHRRRGRAVLDAPGPDWSTGCEGVFVCPGSPPPSDPTCALNGAHGAYTATEIEIARTSSAPGVFDGPFLDHGDSGGPLILRRRDDAADPHDVADLPGPDSYYIVGVASVSGGADVPIGPAPDGQYIAAHAATFGSPYSDVGAWLDKRLADSDADGVANYADNCPFVFNPQQEDTNLLAEVQNERNLGCPALGACPNDLGQAPSSSGAYSDYFQRYLAGDACDPVASTQIERTGGSFANGDMGPCDLIVIGPGTYRYVPNWGGTCPRQVYGSLQMTSWIGDRGGAAASVQGTSEPAFCLCPSGDPAQCRGRAGCSIAADNDFPPPTGQGSLLHWHPMTQQTGFFSRVYQQFAPMSTVHQERTATTYQSFGGQWDFTKDLAALSLPPWTSAVSGVLWAHVDTFNGSATFCPTRDVCDGPLVANINNHYTTTTVTETNGVLARFVPAPIPIPWHVGGWLDGYDGDPGPGDPSELPWTAVLQNADTGTAGVLSQFAGTIRDQSGSYGPSALALLQSVAAGGADLVVGDDVATGITQTAAQPMPALIVTHGATGQVLGALRIQDGRVVGFPAQSGSPATPQDVVAYDAYGARLFAMRATGGSAALATIDIASALAGAGQPVSIPITGDVPTHPVAMRWNAVSRSLYIVDRTGSTPSSIMRLLRLSPSGAAEELWRTLPSCTSPSASLSVSAAGELVLGLSGVPLPSFSEIVVLDRDGRALLSTDVIGTLIAPAFAIPRGIDLPLQGAMAGESNLRTRVVPRRELAPRICGALWLQAQVDTSSGPSGVGSCAHDDGGDDEED